MTSYNLTYAKLSLFINADFLTRPLNAHWNVMLNQIMHEGKRDKALSASQMAEAINKAYTSYGPLDENRQNIVDEEYVRAKLKAIHQTFAKYSVHYSNVGITNCIEAEGSLNLASDVQTVGILIKANLLCEMECIVYGNKGASIIERYLI